MRIRMSAVVVVVAVIVTTVVTLAQNTPATGTISGTVRDASGAVIPGVRVEVSSPALVEKVRSAITANDGQYRITNLPLGTYTVRFSLEGFTTREQSNVVLTNGFVATVNAMLAVGSRSETITVAAAAPKGVDVQNARQRVVFEGDSIQGLPALRQGFIGDVGNGRRIPGTPFNTETYDAIEENGLKRVANAPLSTFSIDVDTASYANVRRFISDGTMPPAGAVRIEELVNYFRFQYPQPKNGEPFSITTELSECPWEPRHRLALIGIQGRQLEEREPSPRNLVFLLDVSGSMTDADKLPLVRNAMRMLVDVLRPRDRVAIVVYAGSSGLVLPSTPGTQKEAILGAIARLEAGGSTNGASGIRLAYQVARQNFIRGGVNRVILATDGDFNVGVTNQDELVRLIEEERASGVFLSVLGVGTGNLKDSTMEKLADKGNGNYAYLDSLHEARKVLVNEAGGTLDTIAKDVKIQIEFNPNIVSAYRLIGYENRLLKDEDFNDDRKDAGEIGAGHSVTALYEIVPVGVETDAPSVDPLRYQQRAQPTRAADSAELATVKVRYKAPDGDTSRLLTTVLRNRPQAMSANLGFGSAVAEFGMLLRNSSYRGRASFPALIARAREFRGTDSEGYRAEFIRLAGLASSLHRVREDERELSRR
jgi:Ca-activated chloride channel family protein